MEPHTLKLVVAGFCLAVFLLPAVQKPREPFEGNHLVSVVMCLLMPAWVFGLAPLDAPHLPLLLAAYLISFTGSTALIVGLKAPQVPLKSHELSLPGFLTRLLNQAGRIVNEELFFRGLCLLLPMAALPDLPWWLVALPQALLFAFIHYIPVRACLKGSAPAWHLFVAAFFFPLLGSMVFGYLAAVTGSLWLPMLLHYGTNAVVELIHQHRRTTVEFTYRRGGPGVARAA